jgi:hypothetical protein
MPLVHRFSGPEFAPSKSGAGRAVSKPSPALADSATTMPEVGSNEGCPLCVARLPMFDLSRRCCADRYEGQFGSVDLHRSLIANARQAALTGDMGPAWRLVESYRRVFGALPAAELKRNLWRSIGALRPRHLTEPAGPAVAAE